MALRCHFFSTLSTLSSKIWWVTQWSDKEMFSQPPHLFDFAFLSSIERSLSIPMPSPAESLNGCLLTLWWYPKKPTKSTAGAFLDHLYLSTGAYCPDNRAQNPSVLLMDVLQALLDFLPWYEKHHLKGQVIAAAMVTGFIFNFISYGYRTGRLNRSKWWADDSSASLPLSYQNKRLQH